VGDDLIAHLVNITDGGADYSFECIATSTSCAKRSNAVTGLGGIGNHRSCGRGKTIQTRHFSW